MPSFQAWKDQLSRPFRSEALPPSPRRARDLPDRTGSGVVRPAPALVTAFCDWFRTHRGVKEPTLRHYARGATDLLRTLGEDVGQWNAQAVRDFLLERASQCGTSTTQALITSLRAFLRFLNFRGECPRRSRPRDTRGGPLAAGEVAALFVSGRGRPADRRVQRHRLRAASRPGDLTDVGAIGIALRRCGASPSHRHRLEQRHVAGNGERAIPGAIATPAGCRRCIAPISGMPARRTSIPITCSFEATPLAGPLPPGTVSRPW